MEPVTDSDVTKMAVTIADFFKKKITLEQAKNILSSNEKET